MTDFTVVLLPGLDGTGTLFRPLLAHLPPNLRSLVVTYPTDELLGYEELLPRVLDVLPTSAPFVLLGESFSGPLVLMAAARSPVGLRGVILCASFVRNPLPAGSALLRHLVRGSCFRVAPEFARSWALLGRYATPSLRRLSSEAIDAVSPQVLAHRVRTVLNVDVRRELEACRVPVLYLRGTHDRVVGRRNMDEVIACSASATVEEIAAPHFVLQAQPGAAAAAVWKFLAALPSNPPTMKPSAGQA
jgi:pimeloyl-[acyl-carrier protein] methyl ester esterase